MNAITNDIEQPGALEHLTAAVDRLAALVEKLACIMDKRVLTIDEAATYTGLTKRTLRDMVRHREIAHAIVRGNEVVFEKSVLEAYMLQLRVPSRDEAETREADAYVTGRTAVDVTKVTPKRKRRQAATPVLAAMGNIAKQIGGIGHV